MGADIWEKWVNLVDLVLGDALAQARDHAGHLGGEHVPSAWGGG